MHDLDRSQLEFDPEGDYLEMDQFEYDAGEIDAQSEGPFPESEEMELASQLLEIRDDAELDQFLGGLIKKAGRFLKSPTGRALGGVLKGIAKKALPVVGGALGSMVAPGIGTAIGSNLASSAGSLFGLELEGMSGEDMDFEVARRYVRLAGAAAQNAAAAPPTMPPASIAKAAVVEAAKNHAPGLIARNGDSQTGLPRMTGRWVRRGNKIILYGIR